MSNTSNLDNINETISINLRRLRKDRDMTLDRLSELTGVSKSMLGQIERGESSPSVATLWKISTGLKISFTSLMTEPKREAEIIDHGAITPLTNGTDLFRLYPVFPFEPGRNFEILHIEVEPSAVSPSSPHEPGTEEFVLIYEGNLTLSVGDMTYEVPSGHSIRYLADQPHSYANHTDSLVRMCMVIYYAV